MPCWELNAIGRVQGVGFRWFVLRSANKHQINGYVKNLADGTVQIIAEGKIEALELFANEIKQGNARAIVQQLLSYELTQYSEYKDFFIA